MATVADVQAFLAGRYRKAAQLNAKMSDLVHPAALKSESDILAGLLGRKFSSSISGPFIRKSGQTVEGVCNETIARSPWAAKLLTNELKAFTDGRVSAGQPFKSVAADVTTAMEWRDGLAEHLGVSPRRLPRPEPGESALQYQRRVAEELQ